MPIEMRSPSGEPLDQVINNIAKVYRHNLLLATKEIVIMVHQAVPIYPVASGRPFRFKTMRQYIFVVRSIREGSMRVPYRRTGTLGRSIHTEVRELGGDFIGMIGSNISYAPDVISSEMTPDGRGPQANYHMGTWYTLQGVVTGQRDNIKEVYRKYVQSALASFK